MSDRNYDDFIEEVFLEPVRSVLIIDDDYPTFEEILQLKREEIDGKETNSDKEWRKDPDRVLHLISNIRKRKLPPLIDIYDGTTSDSKEETMVAGRLHQSDLLILDYELERAKKEDGTRAIEILRALTQKDHFNLVVLYTHCDLGKVFDVVRLGLLSPCSNLLPPGKEAEPRELIDKKGDDIEGFERQLSDSIGTEQYFHFRCHGGKALRAMVKGKAPYTKFGQVCQLAGLGPAERHLVAKYTLRCFEHRHQGELNGTTHPGLQWSTDSQVRWIKTESMFVTFSNKAETDDLISELKKGLNAWNPNPSRLFLTKLRAVMDEQGIADQDRNLHQREALAYWYDQLLQAEEPELRWLVSLSVARHSEGMMRTILPSIEEFTKRLIDSDRSEPIKDKCKLRFGVDLTDREVRRDAKLAHNAFVCGKQPEGWHLTTGHIFKIEDEESQYWLCVSPACDMVTSQLSSQRKKDFVDFLPFIAVRMWMRKKSGLPSDPNRYLFLNLDGSVKVFCFSDPAGANSAPDWHTLYAKDGGIFGDCFRFAIAKTEIRESVLEVKTRDARVVAQLRYEYALNFVQRLGSSLTRIGLDFVTEREADE